jgi:hypothetical protein
VCTGGHAPEIPLPVSLVQYPVVTVSSIKPRGRNTHRDDRFQVARGRVIQFVRTVGVECMRNVKYEIREYTLARDTRVDHPRDHRCLEARAPGTFSSLSSTVPQFQTQPGITILPLTPTHLS